MSDFLDRLASRAIGSDTALVPRLPSLFEPLQKAPIMSASDEGEVPSDDRAALTATTAVQPAVAMQPLRTASPAEQSASRVMPGDRQELSESTPAAAYPPRDGLPAPSDRVAPMRKPTVEPVAAPSTLERPSASSRPSPALPRQTRIAPGPPQPAPLSAIGSLRPTPAPVFGTSRAGSASAPSGHAAPRVPTAASGGRVEAARAPVVHVSIGRLEVRAAAAATTPPRRRDGPQPASLDDYLRQRGEKVSP